MITILLLLALIVLTAISIWVVGRYIDNDLPVVFTILCALTLLVYTIGIIASRMGYKDDLQKIQAFKQTLQVARADSTSTYERAAMTKQIIEWNERIASAKYWNNTLILDICIDDRFANYEPLK